MTENVLCVLIRRPTIPECPLESKEAGDLKFHSVDLLQVSEKKLKTLLHYSAFLILNPLMADGQSIYRFGLGFLIRVK